MYIQHLASKERGIDKRNILTYALCMLSILSIAMVALDITNVVTAVSKVCIHNNNFSVYYTGQAALPSDPTESILVRLEALSYTANTVVGLTDFISQGILVRINLCSTF